MNNDDLTHRLYMLLFRVEQQRHRGDIIDKIGILSVMIITAVWTYIVIRFFLKLI